MGTLTRALALVAMLPLVLPATVVAEERAGVVTSAQGPVTVVRTAGVTPSPLKFKDDVFLQDRVATGDRALARMLLGGKAIVTVREHSAVTITEMPGRSIVDLATGRMALTVAKERMKSGESIEIRTPNAVASVRGTVVVAEINGAGTANVASAFTVLRGNVDVTRIDAAQTPVGAPVNVGALQKVDVDGTQPQPLPAAQPVAPVIIAQINADFQVPITQAPPAAVSSAASVVASTHLRRAVDVTNAALGTPTTTTTTTASSSSTSSSSSSSSTSGSSTSGSSGSSGSSSTSSGSGTSGTDSTSDKTEDQKGGRGRGRDQAPGQTGDKPGLGLGRDKDKPKFLTTSPVTITPSLVQPTPPSSSLQQASKISNTILTETIPVTQLNSLSNGNGNSGGGGNVSSSVGSSTSNSAGGSSSSSGGGSSSSSSSISSSSSSSSGSGTSVASSSSGNGNSGSNSNSGSSGSNGNSGNGNGRGRTKR